MEATFFPYILAFAWIGILLMVGTFVRSKIKIFQTLLFPASLIGGLIGFGLLNMNLLIIPTSNGVLDIVPKVFALITFHLFAFGFVGIGLLEKANADKSDNKNLLRGSMWMAIIFGLLFSVQALIGLGTFSAWQNLFGGDFFTGNGYLLGAGFTQGPGQTQAYATIWEQTYGMANSISTGLAFAAIGFLVAGLVGTPLAFYGIKKKWTTEPHAGTLPKEFLTGILDPENREGCASATTHPANIDTLAFHVGLMAAIYGGAYLFALVWFLYMPKGLNGLGFGLVFIWGMMAAMLARKAMRKFGIIHLIDQEMVRRITSSTVDFMICAVFMGIQVAALSNIVMPFIISIILATFATLFICLWFGRRCPEYGFERGVSLFGYCTGTAASALLLLRIVDPKFQTPVLVEIGFMNVVAFVIFKPISFSMPFVPMDGFPMHWIFLGVVVASVIALFALKLVTWQRKF